LVFVLLPVLVLLACDGAVSPTAPAAAPQTTDSVTVGAARSPILVTPGVAEEFMLRARGATSGPFGLPGVPLVGNAWVHVTGPPVTASVEVLTTGPPNPDGTIPTSHTFTLPSGEYFRTEDLATLTPPFAGPGEYTLDSTLTIVEGGAFGGIRGTLEIRHGVFNLDADFMVTTEWLMKGRVRPGG
jgi:hypothetical protein